MEVDYVRLALMLQVALVLVLYIPAAYRRGRQLYEQGQPKTPGAQLSRGRLVTQFGFIFVMLGFAQGYVELWGTGYTARLLWGQIGIWAALASWYLVDRREWVIT